VRPKWAASGCPDPNRIGLRCQRAGKPRFQTQAAHLHLCRRIKQTFPKWEIIKATARTIKTVAEGAAGNILGELAKSHVQTLLALAAGAAGG